ncbi:MAG TPA: tetratricopeptide repeat protein [Polyangiales bacterium]|nr:tetratricopeptide repeat protein [Polyangiales bacterium]
MRDADDEIREIKTEIIESRGLIIKTNNLTNSLASDIKQIAKRQASYERGVTLNSWVAYLLFAILSFVGLKLWSDVRINEIDSEKNDLQREVKELRHDLAEETRRGEQREQAESKAAAYYNLIRQKDFQKVVEGYDDIAKEALSKSEAEFFRDTAERYRLELSMQAYQNGVNLMGNGRYAEAAEAFRESMRYKEEASHMPSVRFHLAKTLRALGRPAEAEVLARTVVEQTIDKDLQDDAALLLGLCAEDLGRIDDARNELRTLVRKWPRSQLVPDALKKLSDLNLRAWKKRNGEGPTPPAPG